MRAALCRGGLASHADGIPTDAGGALGGEDDGWVDLKSSVGGRRPGMNTFYGCQVPFDGWPLWDSVVSAYAGGGGRATPPRPPRQTQSAAPARTAGQC